MIMIMRVRRAWARAHAHYRFPWCRQCRWGREAQRTGEFYEHDEPRWAVAEMGRRRYPLVTAPPSRGETYWWTPEHGLCRYTASAHGAVRHAWTHERGR